MSLTISLRVPDGLVIAADSLSSTRGLINVGGEISGKCPKCKEEIKLDGIQVPAMPTSTRSFAQKLFPFYESQFGIATYGTGILVGKTIYYHARELEKRLEDQEGNISGVTEAAGVIGKYFAKLVGREVGDVSKIPEEGLILGFQVVGYDKDVGKTVLVKIGKKTVTEAYDKAGCTYGGDGEVVQKIWELGKLNRPVIYEIFSLQDAVDYAQFLIETTAKFQRFTNSVPSVGGEVDVALVTVYGGFKWIQRKKIQKILEEQEK